MAKRGRPRKGEQRQVWVKYSRVGLYIMPDQRARLNWLCRQLGDISQSDALAAALDNAGVPANVPEQVSA
jgi:hypothetical protein